MSSTMRYILVFVVGILVGLAAGAWGLRAMWHHGPPKPQTILKMMDCKLHLTAEQKVKAEVILTEEFAKMKTLREGVSGQFEALRDASAERMRAILTPEQQTTFDEMKKKFEKHGRRGFPPPPCEGTPPPPGAPK
jgi:hypothetical protein